MQRIISYTLLFLLIVCSASAQNAKRQEEIRAVWLTTVKNLDWPRTFAKTNSGREQQKQELIDMLDRLKAVNINTVLLQTRVRGTTIYPSRIEPWDVCLTGKEGVSPGYDPLQFAIDECHKRGMEIHAWVVTLPIGKWNSKGCTMLRKKHSSMVRKVRDEGYMNPEQPETADYLANICAEITQNYNIDGIHLDYIRYPDYWRIKVSKQTGRNNITSIVRKIHNRIKTIKPHIKLSCSPIGKYDDLSRYSSKGWNARTAVCQDAQAWLREGIMDQLYPMMYFQGNNFYPFALDWAENRYGKDVASGLGIYFLDRREGNWKIEEIKRQLNVIRQLGLGQCFFRAKFLLDNHQGIYDYLRIFNFPEGWQENGFRLPDSWLFAHSKEIQRVPDIQNAQIPSKSDVKTKLFLVKTRYFSMEKDPMLDARYLVLETLEGTPVTTRTWTSDRIDLGGVPNGMYWIKSLNKKGKTHRMGMIKVER